jgi:uncharacterized protein
MFPPVEKTFDWDPSKSDRNRLERRLRFELVVMLFDRPTLERQDATLDYHEARTLVIGTVTVVCVYTDRGLVRRIISLRPANRREKDVYRAAFQN